MNEKNGIFVRVAVVERWVVGSEEFSQHDGDSLFETRWTGRDSNRMGRDSRHGRRNSIVLEMYMLAILSVYQNTLDDMDRTMPRMSPRTSPRTSPRKIT